MLKYLMLMMLFVACNDHDDAENCSGGIEGEYAMPDIGYYSRNIEPYLTPQKGFSCQEFEARREIVNVKSYNNSCGVIPYSGHVLEDDVQMSGGENISTQNTIVDGVKEARTLVNDDEFSYFINGNKIQIIDLATRNIKIEVEHDLISPKLIKSEDYLIMTGRHYSASEIEIYKIEGEQLIKVKSHQLIGDVELFLNSDKLIVLSRSYKRDERIECESIYYINKSKNENLFSHFEIDFIGDELSLELKMSILGDVKAHVDHDKVYYYTDYYPFFENPQNRIMKSVTGDLISSDLFNGYIPGKFALKSYGEKLVTFMVKENSNNHLIVWNEELEIIAEVGDVAVGEQVFAARFDNESAYLITAIRIDPLFTFDLSDLMNPRLMGEFKLPEISHYVHPLSNDRLIGIASPSTSWWDNKAAFVLFDVSDKESPTKVNQVDIEFNGYSFEAFHNHHAVTHYNDMMLIKSGKDAWIIKVEDDDIILLGELSFNDKHAEFVFVGNTLMMFSEYDHKIYSLEEGLPELVW